MSDHASIQNNIIEAYNLLLQKTIRTCEHHGGDNLVLNRMLRELRTFISSFVEHDELFTQEEVDNCEDSLSLAFSMLVEAREAVPPRQPLPVSTRLRTGRPGRPKVHVDPQLLAQSMDIRGCMTGLAAVFKCSSRTLRRIALAAQLVEPGAPVISYEWDEDGNLYRIHQSSTPRVAALSDDELDDIVRRILRNFPKHGRGSLWGALKSRGYSVPEPRITASMLRLRGVSRPFGRNDNRERKYKTDGPLSSVHHDGQHGLIRYKIVFHCFIDGFSRFIMGLRAHNNNRAQTVLDLFEETVVRPHGLPSRVRGDHGVENVLVAQYMFQHSKLGPAKKPYIWGPSKNNTRCERVWYDMSQGVGHGWKDFFVILEDDYELDVDNTAHIWLLHVLFLPAINTDLDEWTQMWNCHKMRIQDERNRSPEDMFYFGFMEYGLRGQDSDDIIRLRSRGPAPLPTFSNGNRLDEVDVDEELLEEDEHVNIDDNESDEDVPDSEEGLDPPAYNDHINMNPSSHIGERGFPASGEDGEPVPDVGEDDEDDGSNEDDENEDDDLDNDGLIVEIDEFGNEVLVEAGFDATGGQDGADIDITEVLSEDVRRILLDEEAAEDGSRSAVAGTREPNPFVTTNIPRSLSRISCKAPFCPFDSVQLSAFIDFVEGRADDGMESKETMAHLWEECLEFCRGQIRFM